MTKHGQWTWREGAEPDTKNTEATTPDAKGIKKPQSRPAVLADIDGVLADANHRQHFLRGGKQDWTGFFSACVDDPPIANMVELMNWLDPKLTIVALTARPHWIYDETVDWLNHHGVRWDLLIARSKSEDHLSAKEFKTLVVRSLIGMGFDFQVGFEDDPVNVEAIKQTGVPCVYVHSGYYDHKGPKDPPT